MNFFFFLLFQPAVSVGNVGQLAIDLIISTLNMHKIGYFYTDCLVPMVGNNPYATAEENSAELSINAEGVLYPSMRQSCVKSQPDSPWVSVGTWSGSLESTVVPCSPAHTLDYSPLERYACICTLG